MTVALTSHGPATLSQERNSLAAQIPFVIPQVLFAGGRTQQKMGQGLVATVTASLPLTDFTIVHNLGHPVQMMWAVMAPAGTAIPLVKISATSNPSPNKQVIVQFVTAANPVSVVLF